LVFSNSSADLNWTGDPYYYEYNWEDSEVLKDALKTFVHFQVSTAVAKLEKLAFVFLIPILLFFGFASNLAVFAVSIRKSVRKCYYPSIYFTALCIINVIDLSIRAYHEYIIINRVFRHPSEGLCKLWFFMYSFVSDSRYLVLAILVYDRCLTRLEGLVGSGVIGPRVGGRIQAMARAVCKETSARLITLLCFMLAATHNIWLWWTVTKDDHYCSVPHDRAWQMAFNFSFKLMVLLSIVASCICIVVTQLKYGMNSLKLESNRFEEHSNTEAVQRINGDPSSTSQGAPQDDIQDSLNLIVLCLSIGFEVSQTLGLSVHLQHTFGNWSNNFNHIVVFPILRMIANVSSTAFLVHIPVVYISFLKRLLVREVKHLFGEVKDQVMGMRGRVAAGLTDRIALFEPNNRGERGAVPFVSVQEHSA